MYLKYKKRRIHKSSLHPSKRKHLPLTKISYANSPPMYMTTLISKTTPLFCHEWQRVSKSGSHHVVTERTSILILIIIIFRITIVVLILGCLWRRRGILYEATKASLSSCNMADMGVHPTQLITECVKASIHALQLRHDPLEGHTTRR